MELAFAAPFGLVIGSFLNVVAYRLPRGESLVAPGSHCPGCNAPIKPWDNVPILSWLLLRGRCRGCGERISPRYPLVELATAADRKSTRLNSSHQIISYAVFCLNKKII